MASLRLAAACMSWLLPAGALLTRRRRSLIYPAALATAVTVSAAVLADELLARRGDTVTTSVLAALRIHEQDEVQRARRASAGRWPGSAGGAG